jgi:hypothetical protein
MAFAPIVAPPVVSAPASSSTEMIPGGDAGVARTEDAMCAAVHASTADPFVVGFARQLAASSTPYPTTAQEQAARRIYAFLWGAWRFVDDPLDRELLRTPHAMLCEYAACGVIMGDCDEAALLGAALAAAVNVQAAFTVLEFAGNTSASYSHVYAVLLPIGGAAVSLDITRPPRGTPVPDVVRSATRLV